MTLDLLTNVPTRQTTCAHAHGLDPIIPIGLPCKEENSTEATVEPHKGIDPLAYYFTLGAMPLIDDRIKFSNFTTTGGQPIKNLRQWLRAIEAGEWGC